MTEVHDLLVIGDCNPDVVLEGGDLVPAFGQQEKLIGSAALVLGGSGAITAVQAARLGLSTAFVGIIGDDVLGRWCLAEMETAGVDVSGCSIEQGERTGLTVVISKGDQEGDRAMLTYRGAMASLEASRVRLDLVLRSRHIHFASYFLQPRMAAGIPTLAAAAHRQGASVSLDPNWDPAGIWDSGIATVLASVDILFANEEEVRHIHREGDEPGSSAAALGSGGTTVIMKRGPQGALLISGPTSRTVSCPLPSDAAVRDSTGAGDSFDAGFLAGRLRGLDDAASLLLGCYCGTKVVTALGGTAGQPDRGEVRENLGFDI